MQCNLVLSTAHFLVCQVCESPDARQGLTLNSGRPAIQKGQGYTQAQQEHALQNFEDRNQF
jgi:hypothetical protein